MLTVVGLLVLGACSLALEPYFDAQASDADVYQYLIERDADDLCFLHRHWQRDRSRKALAAEFVRRDKKPSDCPAALF